MKSDYYVLTVKDYLPLSKQKSIEKEIANYISKVWDSYKFQCIFIPTGANPIEENDIPVGNRLENIINDKKIFTMKIPKTPKKSKLIFNKARFAICTRMHSAIFAITEYTPFIAVAYEHKSNGLLKSLDLEEWLINMSETTEKKLMQMTKKLISEKVYDRFIKKLKVQRKMIMLYRGILKNDITCNNQDVYYEN